MEDHTDSISENHGSSQAKCNLKNIAFGIKHIYQMAINKVKSPGFKDELKGFAFWAFKSIAICTAIGIAFIHIFYWLGLAKVSLLGAYEGRKIETESLPYFMFGEDPNMKVGYIFAEGLSVLGWALFAFVIIQILRMIASGICDLGQKQIELQDNDK